MPGANAQECLPNTSSTNPNESAESCHDTIVLHMELFRSEQWVQVHCAEGRGSFDSSPFCKGQKKASVRPFPPLFIGIDLVWHSTHICAVSGIWYFLEKCLLPWKVPQVCSCVMFPSRLYLTLICKRQKKKKIAGTLRSGKCFWPTQAWVDAS